MSVPKRYSLQHALVGERSPARMIEDADGEYVLSTDYNDLSQQCEAANRRANELCTEMYNYQEGELNQISELKAQLATAQGKREELETCLSVYKRRGI